MDADIDLVIDFLNTRDVEDDTDVLALDAAWQRWAHDRGLRPDPRVEAVRARDALRRAVGDPAASDGDVRVGVEIALTSAGAVLVAERAVPAVLAAAARLVVRGEWGRVKICPDGTCRWAFYDRSRNRSRTWCSMQVCGNRQKARTFRQRTVHTLPEPVDNSVDNSRGCG